MQGFGMTLSLDLDFGGGPALDGSKAGLLTGGHLPLREIFCVAPLRALLVMVTVPL